MGMEQSVGSLADGRPAPIELKSIPMRSSGQVNRPAASVCLAIASMEQAGAPLHQPDKKFQKIEAAQIAPGVAAPDSVYDRLAVELRNDCLAILGCPSAEYLMEVRLRGCADLISLDDLANIFKLGISSCGAAEYPKVSPRNWFRTNVTIEIELRRPPHYRSDVERSVSASYLPKAVLVFHGSEGRGMRHGIIEQPKFAVSTSPL